MLAKLLLRKQFNVFKQIRNFSNKHKQASESQQSDSLFENLYRPYVDQIFKEQELKSSDMDVQ